MRRCAAAKTRLLQFWLDIIRENPNPPDAQRHLQPRIRSVAIGHKPVAAI
jgi:hypothetical protein